MYRRDNSFRNTMIATTILIVIAIVGVLAIFRYAYKAVPTVVVTSTSTEMTVGASSTPPSIIITAILPHRAPSVHAYGSTSFVAGQTITFKDFSLTVTKVLEDSRCPYNARCIQAGTVRLAVEVTPLKQGSIPALAPETVTLQLGKATSSPAAQLTLVSVTPENYAGTQPVPPVEKHFFIDVEKARATAATSPCVIGGCSRELCSDSPKISTCIYKASYSCYASATCERQPSGTCDWTPSVTLNACIAVADAQGTNTGTQ